MVTADAGNEDHCVPGIALTQLELTGAIKAMKLRSVAAVREDLLLTKAQIGHTIIASVAITIVARLASDSRVLSFFGTVIASEARQSHWGKEGYCGNEIATSLRSSR